MTNSRFALISAAIAFFIPLVVGGINAFTVSLGLWMALPFGIFSGLVRKLPSPAYLLLCLAALVFSIYIGWLVAANRLGARGSVAFLFVPFYQLFALNIIPLLHIAWRIIKEPTQTPPPTDTPQSLTPRF